MIYLSGPISSFAAEPGRRATEEAANIAHFHRAAAALRAAGYDVVSPPEVCPEPDLPWETYLRRDLAALLTCDAICMLPGWERSRGARLERHVALELGMPCHGLEWYVVRAKKIAAT